jgi:hypothetical protein
MRLSACLVFALMLGAASPISTAVAPAVFRTWSNHSKSPLAITAGGVTVRVIATPCNVVEQNEGCAEEGASNQAVVTVTGPGVKPFKMISDQQASFVRVATIRGAGEPERPVVVVDNQSGGSAGITAVTVIEPVPGGFRAVPLEHDGSRELTGEVTILPLDVLKDGRPGFVLEARGFNYSGECNACTHGTPLVLSVRDGRSIDISSDPAVRPLFARDLPVRRRICVSPEEERNGSCAAFVADAARLGRSRRRGGSCSTIIVMRRPATPPRCARSW